MRINWGFRIVVLYIGFVALIVFLVSMAMRQKVDLVAKDYYEQELHYQEKINKTNHTQTLKSPLTWQVKRDELTLQFPDEFKGKKISGTINFFRPSDAGLDKIIKLPADTSIFKSIATYQLKKGMYKMQINWGVNKEEYYTEGVIQIN